MDDDGDMAEMYLIEKSYGWIYRSVDGASFSSPVSLVSSPPDSRKL
jgi:magnesium transporter